MPGDWHALKNFQIALMKPYFDLGLKNIAQVAGYPTQQIKTCNQFKRTHAFILEAWESLYRSMLSAFFEHKYTQKQTSDLQLTFIRFFQAGDGDGKERQSKFVELTEELSHMSKQTFKNFTQFIHQMAITDKTWRLWIQFVFTDAMAYISLFLAIRSGDWHLRLHSLKQMGPIFSAFDHLTYQKLIANHIAEIQIMPEPILNMFKYGAFVVSLSGRPWHSVSIDEAHEMGINKEVKASLHIPTPDKINRMAQYLTYRSAMLQNFKSQLFPQKPNKTTTIYPQFSNDRDHYKSEHNVRTQMYHIISNSLFRVVEEDRGNLSNLFTNQAATNEQEHDLLKFREIGENEFLQRIRYFILREPSVKAPNRKKQLLTAFTYMLSNALIFCNQCRAITWSYTLPVN